MAIPALRRHRFPRVVRLRRSDDFARVQRTGARKNGTHLVVLYLRRPALASPTAGSGSRFGLAVSRKVGPAVVRNRVKRWLRECLRREGTAVVGFDVVVIARPSVAAAGYVAVYAEVVEALTQIHRDPGVRREKRAQRGHD